MWSFRNETAASKRFLCEAIHIFTLQQPRHGERLPHQRNFSASRRKPIEIPGSNSRDVKGQIFQLEKDKELN